MPTEPLNARMQAFGVSVFSEMSRLAAEHDAVNLSQGFPDFEGPEAIREAVINAFCHRDYRDPDPAQIAIYKDRVEIRNRGTLNEGITLDDLRDGTVSRRRNPLTAEKTDETVTSEDGEVASAD